MVYGMGAVPVVRAESRRNWLKHSCRRQGRRARCSAERRAASGPLTPFPSPPDAIAEQTGTNGRSNAAMAGGEGAE